MVRLGLRLGAGSVNKSQSCKDSKLEFFRKQILDHLSKLEEKEEAAFKKSMFILEMFKSYPAGTIRTWKGGKKYIKAPDGTWKPKYDSHTRGAKLAISALKKKITEAKDAQEMLQICLNNRDRFSDKNGYPLPFVQELSKYVDGAQAQRQIKELNLEDKESISELSVSSAGATREKAVLALNNLAGKDLINLATGIKARINSEQRNKIVSAAALEKSELNGFEASQHFAVASQIEIAWKNATLAETIDDRGGDKNIVSIKRFAASINIDNEPATAYITAKESVEHGHRIYSLELQEIKKSVVGGGTLSGRKDKRTTPHGQSQTNSGSDHLTTSSPEINEKSSDFEKIQDKYQSAKTIEGDEDEIYIGKETLQGKWKLVEADTPTASHDETSFHKTPGFPTGKDGSTINDRDYGHDRAAQDAVMEIGFDFDGRALRVDNPIVVTNDGIVISGNNRTMSSKIAANKGTDTKYIEALKKRAKKFGFTETQVSEFKNPRVVFEVQQEGSYTTEQFAKFNTSGKKEMGPTEKAVKVSKLITPKTINTIAGKIGEFETLGELYADRNAVQHIFNAFKTSGLVGEFELAKYIETGSITEDGKTFIETALLGSVMSESNIRGFNRPGCKSIRGILVRAITPLIDNKSMGGYNITRELNEAADIAMQVKIQKDKFKNVEEFSQQKTMFEKIDPVAVELAKKLEGTQKAFAEFMQQMNGSLKFAANGEADIFLGDVESKEDILGRFLQVKKAVIDVMNQIPMPALLKSVMKLEEE
jgi:hypothetical protein